MSNSRTEKLAAFVEWSRLHVKGDEKGEAQIFLDRLFQAFGHAGSLDVGGAPEYRVRKATEDGGGTAFADYVWRPLVLIEMKKRAAVLSKYYRQAFDYWTRLVPNRPPNHHQPGSLHHPRLHQAHPIKKTATHK